MSVDPGYPGSELIEDGRGRLCVLYDPVTGGLIQNGSDFYGGPFTSLGGRLFTLQVLPRPFVIHTCMSLVECIANRCDGADWLLLPHGGSRAAGRVPW